jgi:hypothetical protein
MGRKVTEAARNGVASGGGQHSTPAPEVSPRKEPVVILPTAIYGADQLQGVLELRRSTLRREIREGRLRVSKRAGRYWFLGQWVLDWIAGGELKRRQAPPAA